MNKHLEKPKGAIKNEQPRDNIGKRTQNKDAHKNNNTTWKTKMASNTKPQKNEMTPGAHKGKAVPVFLIKQPHLTDISYHPCAQCALSNYLQYM